MMTPADNCQNPIPLPTAPTLLGHSPAEWELSDKSVATIPVLHVINGENYAGAERVQDLLAKQLPNFGFSVGFACVKLDAFDELRESRQTPLYDVSMYGRFDLSAALRVVKVLRQGNYQILHAHTVRTALVGSLASMIAGVPMVYHVHSPATRDTTRRWANQFNGYIERGSLHQASRLIAVSVALANYMATQGVDRSRITVVPNGVPVVSNLRNREKPLGKWTLGVMALFRPRKGIEVLLDAMALLRDQGVDVHLRAVGAFESPDYASEISSRVSELGLARQITWTGFSRHVNDELDQMDLLVLPSLFGEGLPMVVLEAMAAGVPVVAADVEGVSEAIRNGVDGVLVRPGDAEDLAKGIAGILPGQPDWSSMRTSEIERHTSQFSDAAMASRVARVYREVLGSEEA
jgi:glycosyltransferase involved in cell wall biosynthesis